ncbi:hypothetical protein ACFQE5_22420 [Pseudonocardia hispaniensis]|uniref:Uncharacterized protein n=1 Tax=Pseudonocardia hispaniensis TaxID=904933 RepID=A0ABW1J8W3_9PSEU
MIRPSLLPRVRDRAATLLADPTSTLRRHVELPADVAELTARHLHGELYWMSADMTALAVSAAADLDTVRWSAQDRHAGMGLLVADGGMGQLQLDPTTAAPVAAVSWGPAPGGLLLWLWLDRSHLAAAAARGGVWLDPEEVPPLLPMIGEVLPVTVEPQPVGDIPARVRTIATTVWAAWQLMQQPTLADRTPAPIDRRITRAYARAARPAPEVTIVDLRHLYRPPDPDREPEEPGRTYRHRWVVRGHWKNAWRPSVQQHRRIWVPAYVKGPDGAPLLQRERVNVWRR